jgi:hypothetical protein
MLIARLKWSNKRTQPIPVHSEKNTKELGRMKKTMVKLICGAQKYSRPRTSLR